MYLNAALASCLCTYPKRKGQESNVLASSHPTVQRLIDKETGVFPRYCVRCKQWKPFKDFKGSYQLAGVYCASCRDIRNSPKVRRAQENAAGRQPLGKRQRFLVLRRDNFACQYCGRSAPNVTLHVDHKIPVALGGTNDFTNLVTACADCNLGKSATAI